MSAVAAFVLSTSLAAAAALSGGVRWGGLVMGVLCTALLAWRGGVLPLTMLAALFVFGVLATKIGAERKRVAGAAQELRGAPHVLANAGPAMLLLSWDGGLLGVCGACAALCGALADTLSSELGMLSRRRPRLMLLGPVVATGANGGMSWLGTFVAAVTAVAAGTVFGSALDAPVAGVCLAIGAFLAMAVDSLLGVLLERHLPAALGNHVVNFCAALGGGVAAMVLLQVTS